MNGETILEIYNDMEFNSHEFEKTINIKNTNNLPILSSERIWTDKQITELDLVLSKYYK